MFKNGLYGLVGALSLVLGCSYEPAFDVTCDSEGARLDGRECRDGTWVKLNAPDMSELPDTDDTADGQSCSPQTDAELCAALGLTCDPATVTDNCGGSRTIECGTCTTAGQTCGGGGTANVCACSAQSDIEFCMTNGKECDPFTAEDACGDMRTVNCGTCMGLATCASDNTCTCDVQAACTQLAAVCGTVDVDPDDCAGTQTITCGTCDAPNSMCDTSNQCVCEPGFAGDGTTCADVDECADGTDNCDANATCSNTPGGFDCTCNAGYAGDGVTCVSAVDLVTQVQTVEIQMGDTSATGTLPNAVIAANSVPFMTVRLDNTDAQGNRIAVDVSITADDEVTIERDNGAGDATARVYVVEFDPAFATVQSGTFSFSSTTHTEDLPATVATNESFVIFYFQRDNGSEQRQDLFVAGRISPAGTSVDFEREGGDGTVSGHYWVVSAVNSSFSVQHVSSVLDSIAVNIPLAQNADLTRSFVTYSWTSDLADDDADRSFVNCHLIATTAVNCRRRSVDNTIPVVRAQVVTLTGSELVQRGIRSVAGDTDRRSQPLTTAVDEADSIAFGGALGVAGVVALDTNTGSETPGGFFTQTIVNGGTEVELERESPRAADADVVWQVIDW